jgi:transposase
VLAELGDDRSRFADAPALKAYAGASPVTRASGKSPHRPAPASQEPATSRCRLPLGVLRAHRLSPGARAHYDRRKAAGDHHTAAQRNLFNRMIGILHHCLTTRTNYDEDIAFPPPQAEASPPAAAA